ncbi:unnamed protein product [Onchocerca ochengi]|uniref:Secreted protein n=1 Tax=Onchocerca ochengi TaxID=42157 RepID=A0A182EKM4_ONCOC|nr:unnamed protein product [Onchocerca ochengi]
MLIPSVIWTITVFTCVVAKANNDENASNMMEANETQEEMEISRKIPHLQMKLETAVATERINNNAFVREKKKFDLQDWLSQKQKQEIRSVSSNCTLEESFESYNDKLKYG